MRKLSILCWLIVLAVTSAPAAPIRSEARLYVKSRAELARLGPLLSQLDICTSGQTEDGRDFLVVFADRNQLDAIRGKGLAVEVTWLDIRDKFRAMTGCEPGSFSGRDFGYYLNYWEVRDTLGQLLARYPAITHLDSSMRSFQNRPLYCLKISDNPGATENEPQVFFNGATHAREPMGTHTCISFASLLCMSYGHDSLVTWLVNNREIYFVPVMNPDGYVYNSDSGGAGAYWRKNRHIIVAPSVGIDLNRNYGYKWGCDDVGSSPSPGSETYRGPSRWSEPEVAAIRDFEAAHRFRTGIDFHTYAQDNLYPWAYTGTPAPEVTLLQEIGDTFEANNGYANTGQWYSSLYPSNGTSVDWELSDTLLGGSPKFVGYVVTSELGIVDFWYGWDDPPYVDAEVALNVPNCYYMTRVGGVYLEPAGMVVNDTLTGNGDGILDPGETANLWFKLKNRALNAIDTAKSVTAVLVPSDTMVHVLTPFANLPKVAPRHGAGDNRLSQIQVQANPAIAPGTIVNLRLEVTFSDDGVTIMQPLNYRLTIGAHSGLGDDADMPRTRLRAVPNPARRSVRFSCSDRSLAPCHSACASGGPATPFAPRHSERSEESRLPGLVIYTADGRLVRRLLVKEGDTMPHRVPLFPDWDAHDDHGHAVPPGIYFARVLGDATASSVRIVLAD
jgi:hypothetical protein